ncbi:serine hydrolase [uncultured Acetobacteroides sp.]|uniref:serine hydrolase domain-containing protein n=1 Tax=uncultured Acetobacteroides sp. TaxID=1760811 RepID=UPI0029F466BF|nr:serine hydrolase [uncultured Acetobacteroides sp.]
MKAKSFLLYVFLLIVVAFAACRKDNANKQDPTPTPTELDDIFDAAASNPNLRCLIVYKDGKIVKEKYYQSNVANTPHDVRSVTKSVMATLVGIAIDKGYIQSEQVPIGDYLKAYLPITDTAKANIKLYHLLTMSAGMFSDELTSTTRYLDWFNAPDQLAFTLNQPFITKPGQSFYYDSGIAHLTSAVLVQATGMSTYQFAKKYLFTPLGIGDRNWLVDKRGINNGGAGLELTPYDMLAIGKLYLNKGSYGNTQVVSESWVAKATTAKITTNNAQPYGPNYGYFFWVGSLSSHDYFFANGYGGQFIVVVPDANLIVVATNSWANVSSTVAIQQWSSTMSIIANKIIPLYNPK